MPIAFRINEQLEQSVQQRVQDRLAAAGFDLQKWPNISLSDEASIGDVAVFVAVTSHCSEEEQHRMNEAINANIRIIVLYLDAESVIPEAVGDYSSSRTLVDSTELEHILIGDTETQQTPTGSEAPKTKITHNKCR